jgi:hypothetical protein
LYEGYSLKDMRRINNTEGIDVVRNEVSNEVSCSNGYSYIESLMPSFLLGFHPIGETISDNRS